MRVAAVQCHAVFDDAPRAGEVVARWLRWAAVEDVDLLVFPEAFLLGHSYDPATIRSRAVDATATALPALCRRIAPFATTVVIGAFHVDDGRVFNSAFVIRDGVIAGRYAKAHPNEPGVTPGTDCPTFLVSGVRYGINICNDANHPDAAARVARQNADLILYPLGNRLKPAVARRWREKSLANLVDRARQTGCWIVSSDVTGASDGLVSFGCTAIVAPDGQVVARVPDLHEGVVVHDVPARRAERKAGGPHGPPPPAGDQPMLTP